MITSPEAEQLTLSTDTAGAPMILAEKSDGLTVMHASGSLNVAVTEVLPGVAVIELKVGRVVSTLSVRVIVGDDVPLPSIARKAKLCDPSPSGAGVNVQLAVAVPQPEQLTPEVEKTPPSKLASIRAMPALADWAVPE